MSSSLPPRRARPVYLNLWQIALPVMAVTSILHRLSGFFLLLILPFCIYIWDLSLRSAADFERAQQLLTAWPVQMIGVILIAALGHHLLAGLRFLLLDIHWGIQRDQARKTAWIVNLGSGLLFVICSLVLLGSRLL